MKFLARFALFFAFFCSVSFAEDLPKEDNQRISIYLHPFTLITTLAAKEMPLFLYVTGEFPLSGSNSLIVNPSLWTGGNDNIDVFKFGSGVGIRRFANGEGSGFYLQLMGSLSYFSFEEKFTVYTEKITASTSGPYADILGYIGYSAKYSGISVFFDFGLGYGGSNIKAKASSNEDDLAFSLTATGLAFDINIGLGIPF